MAVEFNGKVHVLTPEAWEADLERRDASDDDGWRLLPVISSGIYANRPRPSPASTGSCSLVACPAHRLRLGTPGGPTSRVTPSGAKHVRRM